MSVLLEDKTANLEATVMEKMTKEKEEQEAQNSKFETEFGRMAQFQQEVEEVLRRRLLGEN